MALTRAQIAALLKSNLHEDSTFADPADLDFYLTLGQQRIVRDAPHVLGVKTGTITTVASTQAYDLASDFYQMRSMYYAAGGRRLYPMDTGEWTVSVEATSSIPEAAPIRYTITHFDDVTDDIWKSRLYPTPDAVYTVNYFYYWMPAAITGSMTPTHCLIGFDELLLWAATIGARQRNDPDGAVDAKQEYDRLMEDYKRYRAQGPDDLRVLADTWGTERRSTLRLPPEYPAV